MNQPNPSRLQALEEKRLELEIREKEWNVSAWGRMIRFAPLVSVIVAVAGLFGTTYWYFAQERLENQRLRQETITSLKRDFASNDPVARVTAAAALADYPNEALVLLVSISSLGAVDGETGLEDVHYTNAVKDSLRQIGEASVQPLLRQVRHIQSEVLQIFPRNMWSEPLSATLQEFYSKPPPPKRLADFWTRSSGIDSMKDNLPDDAFEALLQDLMRPATLSMAIANKNAVEVLADHLRRFRPDTLDLSRLNLTGNFSGALLNGADLSHAYLGYANFSKASLEGANLEGTNLTGADFSRAVLRRAILRRADLNITKLNGASLVGANLEDADAAGADMTDADLREAVLTDSRLSGAKLAATTLNGADLTGAVLTRVDLSGADLTDARLRLAILRKTKLSQVKGFSTIQDLSMTNFRNVEGLSPADRDHAESHGGAFDERVAVTLDAFPEDLTLPDHFSQRLRYDTARKLLIWSGDMTPQERDEVRALSEDVAFRNALFDLWYRTFYLLR